METVELPLTLLRPKFVRKSRILTLLGSVKLLSTCNEMVKNAFSLFATITTHFPDFPSNSRYNRAKYCFGSCTFLNSNFANLTLSFSILRLVIIFSKLQSVIFILKLTVLIHRSGGE